MVLSFGRQRADILLKKCLLALGAYLFGRAGGYKHANAAALVQDAVLGQQVQAFGRRGRVDAQSMRQLVGAGNLRILGVDAAQNAILQHFGNLQINRSLFIQCRGQVLTAFPYVVKWFITCVTNHST